MKKLFSLLVVGMMWATLPLVGVLYYWEHTLRLPEAGHVLLQIFLLPVVFVWAYFWNEKAELDRLRHLEKSNATKTQIRYRLAVSSHEEERFLSGPALPPVNGTGSQAEADSDILFHDVQNSREASSHGPNH